MNAPSQHKVPSMNNISLSILLCSLAACQSKETGTSAEKSNDTATQTIQEEEVYGPENSWFHANLSDVPQGLSGTGYEVGDTAYNFTLQDQFGNEVELYQFYGQVIVLDVFAEWCGPCIEKAPDGEEFYQELVDQGVVFIALMQEQTDGSAPTNEAAARWADTHQLTHPVLADAEKAADPFANIGGGYPTYPVIGPDMTIIKSDLFPPNESDLRVLLESQGIW